MRRTWLRILDLGVILVFVVIGRRTHEETNTLAVIARTAAPFLMAVVLGWLATWPLRSRRPVLEGVFVGLVTTGAGAFLRKVVFGEGIAFPFVLVAGGFLLLGMIGWRAAVMVLARSPREMPGRGARSDR